MGRGHDRPAQVASEFARELGMLLTRGGLKDPRITGLVTVTGAKMGPDLKDITVYLSIHGDEPVKKATLEGLRAAAPYLQREISTALRLRHTPHLRIVYDESVERGDRIDRLLREARARGAAPDATPEAAPDAAPDGEGEK
jgi:ribosome-binding factor A